MAKLEVEIEYLVKRKEEKSFIHKFEKSIWAAWLLLFIAFYIIGKENAAWSCMVICNIFIARDTIIRHLS